MNFMKKNEAGILVCLAIAVPSWLLGKAFPVVGGAVTAIIAGMIIAMFWNKKGKAEAGIKWTSKVILQTAVVLLGFGMNLGVIFQTGKQSLPIILRTITTSLVIARILQKVLKVPANTSILVGVGSSICGGSAIAATAPVIGADDDEMHSRSRSFSSLMCLRQFSSHYSGRRSDLTRCTENHLVSLRERRSMIHHLSLLRHLHGTVCGTLEVRH